LRRLDALRRLLTSVVPEHSLLKKGRRHDELRTPPVKDVLWIDVDVWVVVPLDCSRVVEALHGMYGHGNHTSEKQHGPKHGFFPTAEVRGRQDADEQEGWNGVRQKPRSVGVPPPPMGKMRNRENFEQQPAVGKGQKNEITTETEKTGKQNQCEMWREDDKSAGGAEQAAGNCSPDCVCILQM